MAKKIKGATITIEVTDGESLKSIARKAQAAKKGLDGTGKSAGDVRRNMQAMSGRVESGSKAFARMQQGTGGLVQSYAILASTLFALGAAFRVMQNAADFKALQQSQDAFANQTGVNMNMIAKQLQVATGAQIDLQAAGASTAIMIAKGFTTDQITQVAEASKNAAIALGRNFEDTFNRIVQGTTKAEPELLDELGITLRLETAARKYGAQIGKNYQDLTTYEKSQAVLNETLRQASDNFDAIAGKVPINQLNQLATTFQDLIQGILKFISPLSNFFAKLLNENIVAAVAVIGLFAKSIATQIFPSIEGIGGAFTAAAARSGQAVERMKGQVDSLKVRTDILSNSASGLGVQGKTDLKGQAKGMRKQVGTGSPVLKRAMQGTMSGTDEANLKKALKSAEMQYQKHGKISTGIFKGANIKKVRDMEISFAKMQAGSATTFQKMGFHVQRYATKAKIGMIQLTGHFQTAFAAISRAGAATMTFLGKVMGAAGVLGIVIMVVSSIVQIIKNFDGVILGFRKAMAGFKNMAASVVEFFGFTEKANAMRRSAIEDEVAAQKKYDKATADTKAAEARLKMMKEMRGAAFDFYKTLESFELDPKFKGTTKEVQIFAKQVGTSGLVGQLRLLQKTTDKSTSEFIGLQDQVRANLALLNKMNPVFARLNITMATSADEVEKQVSKLQSLGMVSAELKEITESLVDTRSSLIKQVEGSFFEKELSALDKAVVSLAKYNGAQYDSLLLSQSEMDSTKTIANNTSNTVRGAQEALKIRRNELQVIADMQVITKRLSDRQKIESSLLGIFNTKINARFKKENELIVLAAKRATLDQEQDYILGRIKEQYGEQSREVQLLKQTQEDQLGVMDAQIIALQSQLSLVGQIATTFTETFEKLAQQNFTDILLGDKSSYEGFKAIKDGIQKQLMGIGVERFIVNPMVGGFQKGFDALRGNIAQQLGIVPGGQSIGMTEEEIAENRQSALFTAHIDGMANVMTQHVQNMAKAVKGELPTSISTESATDKMNINASVGILDHYIKEQQGFVNQFTQTIGVLQGQGHIFKGYGHEENSTQIKAYEKVRSEKMSGIDILKGMKGDVLGGDLALADRIQANAGKGLSGILGSAANPMAVSIVDDKVGILEQATGKGADGKIGDAISGAMGGTEGTTGAAGGPLSGIMGMLGMGGGGGGLAGGGILSSIIGMIPGLNMIAPFLSIFGLAKGGIIGLAKGGVMPRYADGGIATQPTYLVGEGKQNEAVVPLPDNRSIPVDLGRGANATNNTSINVNIDGSGASADITADGGSALAEAINASVMSTIMKEQAPGGILNPAG